MGKQKLVLETGRGNIFGTRKNSTQTKISQIILSPSNRTLLKPRKELKISSNNKTKMGELTQSNMKGPKNYNYLANKM